MLVSAINSIGKAAAVTKVEKTAKVGKRAAIDGEQKVHAAQTSREDWEAPKSPEAMSSSAVQAALSGLKQG